MFVSLGLKNALRLVIMSMAFLSYIYLSYFMYRKYLIRHLFFSAVHVISVD